MNKSDITPKRVPKIIPPDIAQQMVEIGRRIDLLRIDAGSTKNVFTADHDINRMTFHRIMQGQDTSLSTLLVIIKALGSNPEAFFEGIQ